MEQTDIASSLWYLGHAVPCPKCHRMCQIMRNAGGRTLCVPCSDEWIMSFQVIKTLSKEEQL